uniref:Secreted protein n=1 Tax=Ixodes ricinus TaxID=34613 RepID=A0A6B0UJN8_IXORI
MCSTAALKVCVLGQACGATMTSQTGVASMLWQRRTNVALALTRCQWVEKTWKTGLHICTDTPSLGSDTRKEKKKITVYNWGGNRPATNKDDTGRWIGDPHLHRWGQMCPPP